MDKQSKFNLLQDIALTREEAEEYFALQEEKEENSNRIFLPMSVVYESEKKRLRVLPYLDLLQKSKVWGIAFHGILISRLQIKASGYLELKEKLHAENALCNRYTGFRHFPSLGNWEKIFAKMHEFDEAMRQFRKHGIGADDLENGVILLSEHDILCSFSPELVHLSCAKNNGTPVKSRFVVYL